MNAVPPWVVRRLVIDPIAVLLGLVALALAPVVLSVCAVVDLVLRRPLPTTRLAAVALAHVVFDAFGLICLFGLWIASGFGAAIRSRWMQELHHRFARWWLGSLLGFTSGLLGLVVSIEDRQPPRPGAVLVFSRHAGPWDSFLLAHTLGESYARRPRIVMKAAMQWFPFVDVVGNRLPNRFIRPRPGGSAEVIRAIEKLARGMGDRDALTIFPEGANFTARRRMGGIRRLFERGDAARAIEAEGLTNVIAPRPGGVMAALRGAPDAEPVFVAHTGLEDLSSLGALWRSVPVRRPLVGRYWRLPRDQVPTEDDRIVDWLFEWWDRIDRWIADHHGAADTVG